MDEPGAEEEAAAKLELSEAGLLGATMFGGCVSEIMAKLVAELVRKHIAKAAEHGFCAAAFDQTKREILQEVVKISNIDTLNDKRFIHVDYRNVKLSKLEIFSLDQEVRVRMMAIVKPAMIKAGILRQLAADRILGIHDVAGQLVFAGGMEPDGLAGKALWYDGAMLSSGSHGLVSCGLGESRMRVG